MKKDSNRNNLIQKQLKIITKKEEKLLKEPNDNYIKNKISPIKDKIEGMVPDKLQSTLELAFQKGFKVVFDKGTDINTYAVNKYPTRKNLRKIDKSTNKKTIFNKSLTIVEGSALGLLGIGLPDIPIYIGVILKSIYEISLSYGFDYSTESEKAFILNIICATVTSGKERSHYFDKIDLISDEIDNNKNPTYNIEDMLIETSNKISVYMLTSKFIQGLPIVGVVGGVTNFLTLQDITTIAKLKYKKRYLRKLSF